MKTSTKLIVGVALPGLVGVGVWYGTRSPSPEPIEAPAPIQVATPSAPAVPASAPTIAHPIAAPASAASAAAPLDVTASLTDLFGRKSVLAMFQLQDFPRRIAATVDNLGRAQAPASLWPLNPAGGRLKVQTLDGAAVIGPDNGMRYTPYLLLIESVDMRQLAATYIQLYPLFQQAYEEIGFPKGYFNDRLVEVIDQLLATPVLNAPIKVRLPTAAGPVQMTHPWKFYVFDAPALQSLSAGQKILLRMGPVNERRVKTKLAEFRRLVTGAQAR